MHTPTLRSPAPEWPLQNSMTAMEESIDGFMAGGQDVHWNMHNIASDEVRASAYVATNERDGLHILSITQIVGPAALDGEVLYCARDLRRPHRLAWQQGMGAENLQYMDMRTLQLAQPDAGEVARVARLLQRAEPVEPAFAEQSTWAGGPVAMVQQIGEQVVYVRAHPLYRLANMSIRLSMAESYLQP